FFFFFSSRRRHTRFSRDWSSDVCSSDLPVVQPDGGEAFALYGGVFTSANLPYRTPILFDADGIDENPFEAQFGHYTTALLPIYRSEERRVGKEWRSRWSPHAALNKSNRQ